MSPTLAIDTDAVRVLARRLDLAADEADHLRVRLLRLLVMAALDDASAAAALGAIDEELRLVAAVLRARASLADYPLHDPTSVALADEVWRAAKALDLVVGPDVDRAAAGREAARRLARQRGRPSDALLEQVLLQAADPSFAFGFTDELSLEGGADLVVASSWAVAQAVTPGSRADWSRRHRLLLDALGQTYATAMRWGGSHTLASAAEWVAVITSGSESSGLSSRGAALAMVLGHGDFDDGFLATVAGGVYEYERSHAQSSLPLWLPRAEAGTSYIGPVAPDGTQSYDPLVSVLLALGGHAGAAQAFFANGPAVGRTIDGAELSVSERLAYLLEARRWPTDGGAALGAALVAATTIVRDRSDAGRLSAQLASQTVALVGARAGQGRGGAWIFTHDGWQLPTALRPALTTIVADYMPDVFQTIQAGVAVLPAEWFTTDNPSFPPSGPLGATFTVKDLAVAIEAIGTEPDRVRELVAAVLGTARLRLGYAIDRLAADDPNLAADFLSDAGGGTRVSLALLSNAAGASGQTLGFVVEHGYRGMRDDEARRAAAQRHLSELLSVAASLPFVPAPTGPWGKLAVKRTTKELFDAWRSSVSRDAATVYASLDQAVAAELRDQVLEELLARGLLRPDIAITGFRPPPADAIAVGADGTPHFDRRSQAYVDWATNYAPNSWIEVQVGLFYTSAFGRVP